MRAPLAILACLACGTALARTPEDEGPRLQKRDGMLRVVEGTLPEGAIQAHAATMRWVEGPPAVPGSRMTVLEGNPREAMLFTMRLAVPAGTRLPLHWHPQDERVTVLSGSVHVGFGDLLDEDAATKFETGDYYVNPANSRHFVWFTEAATLQITGMGPWELHLVEPEAPPKRELKIRTK